jgi:DNA-binding transcriptional regulator WhiA
MGQILFPTKSHRKACKTPPPSTELSEVIGAICGDGGLTEWQLALSFNAQLDFQYAVFIHREIERLFGVDGRLALRRGHRNTIQITFSGRNLSDVLQSLGVSTGNKLKKGLDMPVWVKEYPEYRAAFLRGLLDTDGCIFIDNHKLNNKNYSHLGVCWRSYSPALCVSIAESLKMLGYRPTISSKNSVYLRRQKEIIMFFTEIGSRNLRNLQKAVDFWERCPSGRRGQPRNLLSP